MLLKLPSSIRIYFATELVDMRNGIDGLRALVERTVKAKSFGGHLFVFVGKQKDKVKILYWDGNGFVLYLKRLEQGRFQLPAVDASRKHIAMDATQLSMFLDCIDLNAKRLERWTPPDPEGMGIDTDR
jgi:transposase